MAWVAYSSSNSSSNSSDSSRHSASLATLVEAEDIKPAHFRLLTSASDAQVLIMKREWQVDANRPEN